MGLTDTNFLKTVQQHHKRGLEMIYVLHFENKRHHAQHYLGTTSHLRLRLKSHAIGRGARLTRALWHDNEEWTLAAIYYEHTRLLTQPFPMSRWDIERTAKLRHQNDDYCPLCKPLTYIKPRYTEEYPIRMLPPIINIHASEYRNV